MKNSTLAMMFLCLFLGNAGSVELPDSIEDKVGMERPIYQPMHFNLFIRYRDGQQMSQRPEVARQIFARGMPSDGGGGEYGSSGHRYVIRYVGSINADKVLIEPADIYVVSIVEITRAATWTNHLAVIYQGNRKTVYTSSRINCVLTPEEWRLDEEPTFLEWEDSDSELDPEFKAVGGLRINQAKIVDGRLTMNMPDRHIEDILVIFQHSIGAEIETRVDESILDLKFNAKVEDMYWEDGLNSVLREHGLYLFEDADTGTFAIMRKDDSRN